MLKQALRAFGSSPWGACLLTLTPIAIIYALTISPYVGAGDSGEFIVDAVHWATPHPPGYPTYTFLAHFFSWLPISSMAWRIGFFSLCCQLLCGGVLFWMARAWLGNKTLASAVTVLFCLAPLTWYFAVEAEVFALNNLFAALLLACFWQYHHSRVLGWAYVACAVFGLACTHHLTIILFAGPFFAAYLWLDRKTLLRPRVLLAGFALFLLGLTPYLFLFYLGQQRALFAWGDFSSWEGFWTHVLRKEYGTFQLATGDKENSTFLPKLYYFGREMFIQLFFVGSLAWAWGMVCLWRARPSRERQFARLVAFALVVYVGVFQYLSNLDLKMFLYYHAQSRMWMLPLLLMVLLVGWGLHNIALTWRWRGASAFIGFVVAVVVGAGVVFNWEKQDRSNRDFFARLGHTMIDNVEPGAVILMREDVYVNSLRYLQAIDQVRPDVHMIPLDAMWWPWMKGLVEQNVPGFKMPGAVFRTRGGESGGFNLADLIEQNVDRFPLYVAKIFPYEEQTLQGKVTGFPYGFHSRVKRIGQGFMLPEVKRETSAFLHLALPLPDEHRYESWETFVEENYYAAKFPLAGVMERNAQGRADWLLETVEVYKDLAAASPQYRARALRSLGALYAELSPAYPQFRKLGAEAWESYLTLVPPESEESKQVQMALRNLK